MSDLFETVTPHSMGGKGEAVADIGGQSCFIAFTLPGETVRISRDGQLGDLHEVITPSPDRVEPDCSHFGQCGGCQLQHWADDPYLAFKADQVAVALQRAGIETQINPIIPAYGSGRRRATFHVDRTKAGFRARRTHDLIGIDTCPILMPELANASAIAAVAATLVGPCDARFTVTDTGVDLALEIPKSQAGKSKGNKSKRVDLAPLARQFKLARVALNGEVLIQSRQPILKIGKANVEMPVGSFLQASAAAEQVLADLVIAALGKQKRVVDLFCGVGPFALRIAETAQVAGFDSDRQAVKACHGALNGTPGLKTLGAEYRDLFRDPLIPEELVNYTAIVFDPPRAGAKAQVYEIVQSKVNHVVAVSCDPITFARDAVVLIEGGFKLTEVTPVDQFRYSPHVELVANFKR